MSRTALVVGVANEHSLAWAVARRLHADGFALVMPCESERLVRRVQPLAASLGAQTAVCDVTADDQLDELFSSLTSLDVVIHSVAHAPLDELDGPLHQATRSGFLATLDASAWSLVALSSRAVPLMSGGGSIVTLTHAGSQRVVPHYHLMGVAKAALEACVRYLAADLGRVGIRVNAVSAGPVKTHAAAALRGFEEMRALAERKSMLGVGIDADDVAAMVSFLCGHGARHITGTTMHVDAGLHGVGA